MFVVYPVAAYRDLCPCRDEIKYVCKCILWLRIGICVHAGMRLSMFVVYPVAAYRDLCPCRDEIKYVCSVPCGCV